MSKPTTVLSVNGFEVTATFAENHNAAAVHHVKQILISSFAGKTTKLQYAGNMKFSRYIVSSTIIIIPLNVRDHKDVPRLKFSSFPRK